MASLEALVDLPVELAVVQALLNFEMLAAAVAQLRPMAVSSPSMERSCC